MTDLSDPDRIEELALKCLERLPEEGESVVNKVCREHPELIENVRGVLRQLETVGLMDESDGGLDAAVVRASGSQFGDFRLLRQLGSGGMGVVWLAEQSSLARKVALKLLRPGFHRSQKTRERFRREIAAISRIEHPHICTVYEAGEVEGQPYLAMRHVEGETLAARLSRRKGETTGGSSTTGGQQGSGTERSSRARELTEDITLIEKVARALHAAHEAGVVHRDVKPGNVLIGQDEEPVVVDFGLARAEASGETDLTATGDSVGTPAYMAPEQVSGRGEIDRRTDVYALGVTLYECVSGHAPFESDRRESLYRQILTEMPPNPTARNRAVGRDLRAVLEKALEKEPRRRFVTALEFAEELRRIRSHEPIHTRAPGPALRTLRWCQRNRAATTVLVTVVVALAISLVLLERSRRAEARSRAQALISEARATQPTDPELAFKLGREALRLDPVNPKILAVVQSVMSDLRPYHVVRDARTETNSRSARLEFVKYSPDGKHFVLTGNGLQPTVHRATDGMRIGTLEEKNKLQHPAIAWSMDGRLAYASKSGCVELYDLRADRLVTRESLIAGVRWQPFGVCFGSRGEVLMGRRFGVLWTPEGRRLLIPRRNASTAWKVAFLPDGRFVAAGAIWESDGSSLRQIAVLSDPDARSVVLVEVAPKRDRIITAELGQGDVDVWTHGGDHVCTVSRQVRDPSQGLSRVDLSPNGESMVISFQDGAVRVFGTQQGRYVGSFRTGVAHSIRAGFSHDGKRIISGDWAGMVQIRELDGTLVQTLRGHHNGVFSVAVEPNPLSGQARILTASWDGTARLWSDGPQPGASWVGGLYRPNLDVVQSTGETVVVSGDGRLLLCGPDGQVRRTTSLLAQSPRVSLSPDGRTAIVSSFRGDVWMWDLGATEPRHLEPGLAKLRTVHQLEDGSLLLIGKAGARRWSDRAGAAKIKPDIGRVTAAAVSSDGGTYLLGTAQGAMHLFTLDGEERGHAGRRDPEGMPFIRAAVL
ncbi:MAG: WD40 repeat domain-containing serine/threonine protein kinase, partial [Planctomycetota bacterium]